MPGDAKPWNGQEWEDRVQLVLKTHYSSPPGTYQHIPADVGGDCGLEGYAADGSAYQCYSAQDWPSADVLYEKQRNKLTADIGKLCNNAAEIKKLLGDVKIKQWNLVVPYFNGKDIIAHAKKKQAEVRAKKLDHLDENFRISILTCDDFQIDVQKLANFNLAEFDMALPLVADTELAAWMQKSQNIDMVAALSRKSTLLGPNKSVEATNKFRASIVRNYISGNVTLAQLQQEQPETYGRTLEYKIQSESNLQAESFVSPMVPSEFFKATLDEYKMNLQSIPGISVRVASILAHEAVADWILRCPMDFE